MELQIFSIFDKKTNVYAKPFYAHNKGHAVRLVQDEVDKADSQLNKYSEDFQLCLLGSFFDDIGNIVPSDVSVVMEISELKKEV